MTDDDTKPPVKFLDRRESTYYRDQLRESRYHALANAEGFEAICFALEGLGRRLAGEQLSLGTYRDFIRWYEQYSPHFTQQMLAEFSHLFGSFTALFEAVLQARNDAMHSGVYARHAAARAVELCLALEEALMNAPTDKSRKRRPDHRKTVADYMVKSAVGIETGQPVALARQLMLTHS